MKKLILTVLAFIVVLSLTGVVFADDLSDQINNARAIGEYEIGGIVEMDTISFGSYPQGNDPNEKTPIAWYVLEKKDGKALLLSEQILDYKAWGEFTYQDDKAENNKFKNAAKNRRWKDCYLRQWLNEDFYDNAFGDCDNSVIVDMKTEYTTENENTKKGEKQSTTDKVSLLSLDKWQNILFQASKNEKRFHPSYHLATTRTPYAASVEPYDGETQRLDKNEWLVFPIDIAMPISDNYLYNFYAEKVRIVESSGNTKYDYLRNNFFGIRPIIMVSYNANGEEDNRVNDEYEENKDAADDNSYKEDNYEKDEIPEDYSNAGNMAKSDTVTWGMNGIDVTFKRADLKQGWVKDVEDRKFYFNTYDAANESCNFPTGWKEIDGKYYYFTDHGYILINTTTPDGYKVDRNGVLIEEVQETTKVPETTKPAPKNGWYGDYYYQNDVMVTNNWVEYNGEWYYCGPSGAILKNQWIEKTYYVDSTGKMLRNTTTPTGNKVGADGKYIPDEVIDLDARNNINKQEETKAKEEIAIQPNINSNDSVEDMYILKEDATIKYPGGLSIKVKRGDIVNVDRIVGSYATIKDKYGEGTIAVKYLQKYGEEKKVKASSTQEKQETKKQENRKTEETQEIPQYVLDAWANNDMPKGEREPYILSDDGSTVTFQITARTSAGLHDELYVVDPGYEYYDGLFNKTHAEVALAVADSLLTDKDREILSKISNSTIYAVDDGVGGKYDYDMIKKAKVGVWSNTIILPTISRKEATRISNELHKKLDNDEKIIIKVQYAEHDAEKGKYAVNPIYIGRGKVVVKKEGLIFNSIPSMYVEFEGEAKKKLEEYTRKNKGKYLYLTDSLVDDGSGYVNEVKYFEDDDWLQELINQMDENNVGEDYHTLQVITKTISDGKVHVNLLGNELAYKDPKIFSDADTGYEYALRNASGFPTDLYIIDRMEYYTK